MASQGAVHGILSFAIEVSDDQARSHLLQHLSSFLCGNPASRLLVNAGENVLVICGDDELQLQNLRDDIIAQHYATGELAVTYREAIRRAAQAEGKYIRQVGGMGNYGHCKILVEPRKPGEGYEFINAIASRTLPRNYVDSIDQGIQSAMQHGVLAGHPLGDLKATLIDASHHDFDSNEMAFRFAGSIAFKEAARKASPVLLEPVMAADVTIPERLMGMIVADINSRRGSIDRIVHGAGLLAIRMSIPLAEALSSSAKGRPRYDLQFAGYRPAPTRHGPFGDEAAALAKKPSSPKPGSGSAFAPLEE